MHSFSSRHGQDALFQYKGRYNGRMLHFDDQEKTKETFYCIHACAVHEYHVSPFFYKTLMSRNTLHNKISDLLASWQGITMSSASDDTLNSSLIYRCRESIVHNVLFPIHDDRRLKYCSYAAPKRCSVQSRACNLSTISSAARTCCMNSINSSGRSVAVVLLFVSPRMSLHSSATKFRRTRTYHCQGCMRASPR